MHRRLFFNPAVRVLRLVVSMAVLLGLPMHSHAQSTNSPKTPFKCTCGVSQPGQLTQRIAGTAPPAFQLAQHPARQQVVDVAQGGVGRAFGDGGPLGVG